MPRSTQLFGYVVRIALAVTLLGYCGLAGYLFVNVVLRPNALEGEHAAATFIVAVILGIATMAGGIIVIYVLLVSIAAMLLTLKYDSDEVRRELAPLSGWRITERVAEWFIELGVAMRTKH